jgi:hypothetical protein
LGEGADSYAGVGGPQVYAGYKLTIPGLHDKAERWACHLSSDLSDAEAPIRIVLTPKVLGKGPPLPVNCDREGIAVFGAVSKGIRQKCVYPTSNSTAISLLVMLLDKWC